MQLTKEDASTDTAPPRRGPRQLHVEDIASRTMYRPSSSHGAHSHSHPARHLSCSRWPQHKFSRNVEIEFDEAVPAVRAYPGLAFKLGTYSFTGALRLS